VSREELSPFNMLLYSEKGTISIQQQFQQLSFPATVIDWNDPLSSKELQIPYIILAKRTGT